MITEKDVRVGNQSYKDVTFKKCRMIFDGTLNGKMSFDSCAFINCTWYFEGAAGQTLKFVNDLAEMMGPEGQSFVKSIFKRIF